MLGACSETLLPPTVEVTETEKEICQGMQEAIASLTRSRQDTETTQVGIGRVYDAFEDTCGTLGFKLPH